jgi:hypothetical protein
VLELVASVCVTFLARSEYSSLHTFSCSVSLRERLCLLPTFSVRMHVKLLVRPVFVTWRITCSVKLKTPDFKCAVTRAVNNVRQILYTSGIREFREELKCCCRKTGVHVFSKKSKSHLKILGARRVRCCKFYAGDPQILGAIIQNLVATPCRLGCVRPWFTRNFTCVFAALYPPYSVLQQSAG